MFFEENSLDKELTVNRVKTQKNNRWNSFSSALSPEDRECGHKKTVGKLCPQMDKVKLDF